jgi:hypothetical protein
MAWDTNEIGNITLSPLISYETATLAETGCGVRLILARPEDASGTGSLVAQMAMTVAQAEALVQDVQQMIDRLLGSRPTGRVN